jgi:hypothetical protein
MSVHAIRPQSQPVSAHDATAAIASPCGYQRFYPPAMIHATPSMNERRPEANAVIVRSHPFKVRAAANASATASCSGWANGTQYSQPRKGARR